MVQSYRGGELAVGVHWRKLDKLIPVKDLISAKTKMFLITALLVTQTMRF
ncbi:hypothetical protein [Paraburkholderia sp. HP33-1]|nr:hypothetical protein [Paraburkholderia sp. HP33-1]